METASAIVPPAARPPRRSLADEIRDLIARDFILNDAVPTGGLLPSEKELSARYGASRVTVRASLRSLHEAGMVKVRHGVGWTVLPRSRALMQGLHRMSSLETFAREAGQTVGSVDVEWQRVAADDDLVDRLDIPHGAAVVMVQRVKTLGDARVAWLLDYVPEAILSMEDFQAHFAGSVLDVLLDQTNLDITYGDAEIEPVKLSADTAERLHVESGEVALVIDGVAYSDRDEPVQWARAWLLPQHFRFSVRRRRQIGG